jgi:hypothetical protein
LGGLLILQQPNNNRPKKELVTFSLTHTHILINFRDYNREEEEEEEKKKIPVHKDV